MTSHRPGSPARRRDRVARGVVAMAAAGALLVTLATVALADSPAPSGAPESPAPASSGGPSASGGPAISIVGTAFQPADLTVQVGQTVTWTVTQAIDSPHSVTSGHSTDPNPGSVFDSGIKLRSNGDSFSYTFTTAGSFPYFCAVHPTTMHGTITVNAASGGGTASSTDTSRLITAVILVAAIVLLLGTARLYRRMNPGS